MAKQNKEINDTVIAQKVASLAAEKITVQAKIDELKVRREKMEAEHSVSIKRMQEILAQEKAIEDLKKD